MEPRDVSLATTTSHLKDSHTLPIESTTKEYHQFHRIKKKFTQRAYPAGALAHPEPAPRVKLDPLLQLSWPPPEM